LDAFAEEARHPTGCLGQLRVGQLTLDGEPAADERERGVVRPVLGPVG
jgi:hypothetical protein